MKEVRYNEFRANPDSRTIEGYAAVFNSTSQDLGGFTEVIDPAAFEGVLEQSDVLCLLNHDESRGVLARCRQGSGSLELSVDEKGLYYRFDAPHTALGDELIESIKRGDISQSSFAFTVEDEKWEKRENDTYLRTITKIGRLFDVSPVYTPAYEATSVDRRGLDKVKAEEEQRKLAELEEYYQSLRNKLQ